MDGGGGGLTGVVEPENERIVCHVDMDCFYASCERRREPELEGEPVVIGMGYEPGSDRGAVATASYEARAVGIESAQAISTAIERLPNREAADLDGSVDARTSPDPEGTGYYRPVAMEYYESVSEDVRSILGECSDTVQEVSIDEAYLDVTARTAWDWIDDAGDTGENGPNGDDAANEGVGGIEDPTPTAIAEEGRQTLAAGFARHVKGRIAREVGVTASVGVAPNMSAAKIASDHDKPDGLVVVRPGEVRAFLAPLDVEAVHGIGPVTARALRGEDIETAGDLAAADPGWLGSRFGKRGREFYRRARGEDDREVTPKGRPKSLNRESAFAEATADAECHRKKVRTLAASVAERAERENALYRTIAITVVRPPSDVNSRARSLPGPVCDGALIKAVALDLLDEFDGERIRKVRVCVSNLEFTSGGQSSLDRWDADQVDRGAVTENGAMEANSGDGEAPGTTATENADRRSDDRAGSSSGQASLTDFSI